MVSLTVFKILLFERKPILGPALQVPGSKRVHFSQRIQKVFFSFSWNYLVVLQALNVPDVVFFLSIYLFLSNALCSRKNNEKVVFPDSNKFINFKNQSLDNRSYKVYEQAFN